ncbi:MAG: phosphatidylserine decarboxylase [Campylobacterota bacterium]
MRVSQTEMTVSKVMKSNLLPVSNTGFKYLVSAFLAFIIFSIFEIGFLALISLVLVFVFGFIFRNPEREVPSFEKGSLVSPVDGNVTSIEDIQDSEYAYKLEIDSTYLNVGVLRTPLDSTLESVVTRRGTRLAITSPLCKDINENTELIFVDENSNSVKIVHRLKRSFDGVTIDVKNTQNVKQASRYGVMINGTTTIYLPKNFRLNVTLGSELEGSQTLIGYFS